MDFKLHSQYQPTGDQPQAISQLAEGVEAGVNSQVLLGVTGSGKTFTMANVIEKVRKPTLILSHNKTLAAQLYSEMTQFFPENSVQYFVSYYDYYQPEAYIPSVDKYIEKDLMINDEIDRLRLATTSALLSGRRDVIVVSSVSCLYGMGNPEDFHENVVTVSKGMRISRNAFLRKLVAALYSRNEVDFQRGNFRVKGDTVDIRLAYEDIIVRVVFWGDEVEKVITIHPDDNAHLGTHDSFNIYPANLFVTSPARQASAIAQIQLDLGRQIEYFRREGHLLEAQRIEERVTYDVEMIKELGYCPGIENYSRYFDGRREGERPFCLLDYFPKDYLTIIDESHVTIPQVRAMYGGDRSRKENLVQYGFRLPAALDNRPLKFEEFESMTRQTIYVSATPADYELEQSEGVIVEQVIRPTGLLDPLIRVVPSANQIDHLLEEIQQRIERNERTLVTTLTKRMAEELTEYLGNMGVSTRYLHSDIDTLERIAIIRSLRMGECDVLVGINLLREGLDIPEVSLVAILDADKEGFLRSTGALIQTFGRAARNAAGRVILYADSVTASMRAAMDETERRRTRQLAWNAEYGIVPATVSKSLESPLDSLYGADAPGGRKRKGKSRKELAPVESVPENPEDIAKLIGVLEKDMRSAARELEFEKAAELRDRIHALRERLYLGGDEVQETTGKAVPAPSFAATPNSARNIGKSRVGKKVKPSGGMA